MKSPKHLIRTLKPLSKPTLDRQDGAVAVLFALMLIVILSVVGMAVDHSRQVRLATAIQTALDAAVLSASAPDLNDDSRHETFNRIFQHNFNLDESTRESLEFTFTNTDGGHA